MIPSTDRVNMAVAHIRKKIGDFTPEVGMILGSGLGIMGEEVENPWYLPYSEIPEFPVSTVEGHAGRLVIGTLEGKKVLVMQGRFHYYEGYPIRDIALPVWVMKALGIEKMIVTNAAGGCNPAFSPGDLMLITDHINFAFNNPLIGKNPADFGPRFPDTSEAYDAELGQLAIRVAKENEIDLKAGVYQFNTGPSYETPAEVLMAQKMGADAVGMSTVPEVIAASHCGIRVLGISFISNLGAGLHGSALSHAEVIETIEVIRSKFISFVRGIVKEI